MARGYPAWEAASRSLRASGSTQSEACYTMAALRATPSKSLSARVHIAQRVAPRAAAVVRVASRKQSQTVAFFDFFKARLQASTTAQNRPVLQPTVAGLRCRSLLHDNDAGLIPCCAEEGGGGGGAGPRQGERSSAAKCRFSGPFDSCGGYTPDAVCASGASCEERAVANFSLKRMVSLSPACVPPLREGIEMLGGRDAHIPIPQAQPKSLLAAAALMCSGLYI